MQQQYWPVLAELNKVVSVTVIIDVQVAFMSCVLE